MGGGGQSFSESGAQIPEWGLPFIQSLMGGADQLLQDTINSPRDMIMPESQGS